MSRSMGQLCQLGAAGARSSLVVALLLNGAVPVGGGARAQQSDPIPAVAPPTAAAPLVFDGVTVIDVKQGRLLPAQRVVIVGNRIRAVGSARMVEVAKGAQVVDARGTYMIPGLWDMHLHLTRTIRQAELAYPLLLASGVTGIRDPGSPTSLDTLRLWRRQILAGTRVGPPRQILSGQYITEVGHNHMKGPCLRSTMKTVTTCVSSDTADARHLVDSLKAAGADFIKTYYMSKDIYRAIADAARRAGLPFGGHPAWLKGPPPDASDLGASIIDHTSQLKRFCWAGVGGSLKKCKPIADRYRRNGTWVVPTLPGLNPRATKFWRGSLLHGNWLRDSTTPDPEVSITGTADSLGSMSIVQRAGLPILAGTDVGLSAVPGFRLHREIAMYVAKGLTRLNALQSATLNPAKMLGATDSLGTVAPGKLADLILLDADPLADITNTTTVRAVVANGRYFDRAALDSVLVKVQRARAKKNP